MIDLVKKYKYSVIMMTGLTAFNILMAILHSSEGDNITAPFLFSVGITAIGTVVAYLYFDKPAIKEREGLN